ncbi:hypothetical protein DID88_005898 [Monilinia fructigena]|uniref:Uncharacterized protein n=1 Tax=Monilinia fructigena TaxID=38457 RepID=A0A395J1S8_9HELO|nr:hypothetical protein DID88_005898 [Monilinia fructigena]
MHTLKIARMCKECEKKIASTDRTASKLKQALKDIRETVERMEKMQTDGLNENAKKSSVDADDDLAALESWD